MREKEISCIAEMAAEKAIARLRDAGKVRHQRAGSFRKTEQLLGICPKLSEGHPGRMMVERALESLGDDEYRDVIPSIYFDGLTITELAEIYDCKYQTIGKHKNRIVRLLAAELFPEDVFSEIMET